ncbi:MAG TPA: hypothetical protein VFW87_05485, partial [Pirellulales bacterium]|nr:hypothetical protein [Pirellulales bacterium]
NPAAVMIERAIPTLELPAEPLPPVTPLPTMPLPNMPLPDPSASAEQRPSTAPTGQIAGAAASTPTAAPSDVFLRGVPLRVDESSVSAVYVQGLPSSRRQAGEPSPPSSPPATQAIAAPIALPDVAAEVESTDALPVDPEA